jgi:hypothetical protein
MSQGRKKKCRGIAERRVREKNEAEKIRIAE